MKDYKDITDIFPFITYAYREGNFINFLPEDYHLGSFLLEERSDYIIVWNNELKYNDYEKLYTTLLKYVGCSIYIVYITNQHEYDTLKTMGASPLEFNEEDYPHELGSLLLQPDHA